VLGKMLWEVFGPGGQGFPITVVVTMNFGVWVYSEIIMASGGETRSIEKLKKFMVINIVLGSAIFIVNSIFGKMQGG
jgi:hypothetical protein